MKPVVTPVWSTLRRYRFVFAAALLHLGLFAVAPRHEPAPAPSSPPEALLWLDTQPAPHDPSQHRHADGRVAMITGVAGAGAGEWSRRDLGEASPSSSSNALPEGASPEIVGPQASASSSPMPSLFIPDRAGVGLDGPGAYRVGAAREAASAEQGVPEPTEAERVSEVTRQAIVGPIRAHELRNGGAGGPVVAALEQTARRGLTPNNGRAVFAIQVDALGVVVSVGVENASSDPREWGEIATQSFAALARKRVHLPPGAKGAHIRVEVTSRVQMPSGSTTPITASSPVAEALPKIFSGEKAADSPALIQGGFDVSDIGAHPLRVVGARELSENIF